MSLTAPSSRLAALNTAAFATATPVQSGDTVLHLDLDRIDPNPDQPRLAFDPAEIMALAESIRSEGQLQPCLVRSHPTQPSRYQLVDGEHRFRARQLLRDGYVLPDTDTRREADPTQTLTAVLREVSDAGMLVAALSANMRRVEMSEAEKISAMYRLKGRGLRNPQIAALPAFWERGKPLSESSISERLSLPELVGGVWEAFVAGTISYREARAFRAWQRRLELLRDGTVQSMRQTAGAVEETRPVALPNPALDVAHVMRLTRTALIEEESPNMRSYLAQQLALYGSYPVNTPTLTTRLIPLSTGTEPRKRFNPTVRCAGCQYLLSYTPSGYPDATQRMFCTSTALFAEHQAEAAATPAPIVPTGAEADDDGYTDEDKARIADDTAWLNERLESRSISRSLVGERILEARRAAPNHTLREGAQVLEETVFIPDGIGGSGRYVLVEAVRAAGFGTVLDLPLTIPTRAPAPMQIIEPDRIGDADNEDDDDAADDVFRHGERHHPIAASSRPALNPATAPNYTERQQDGGFVLDPLPEIVGERIGIEGGISTQPATSLDRDTVYNTLEQTVLLLHDIVEQLGGHPQPTEFDPDDLEKLLGKVERLADPHQQAATIVRWVAIAYGASAEI